MYILLQWLAGFCAIGLLLAFWPEPTAAGFPSIKQQLVVQPIGGINNAGIFFYIFLISTFLVIAYLFFVYDRRPTIIVETMTAREVAKAEEEQLRYYTRQNLTPLFIGFIYGAISVYQHPWRVLCACMIAKQCGAAWAYCVGGFLGAFVGAVLYMLLWGLGQKPTLVSSNPLVPATDID